MKLAGLSCIFNQWPQSKHLKCELEKPVCLYLFNSNSFRSCSSHKEQREQNPHFYWISISFCFEPHQSGLLKLCCVHVFAQVSVVLTVGKLSGSLHHRRRVQLLISDLHTHTHTDWLNKITITCTTVGWCNRNTSTRMKRANLQHQSYTKNSHISLASNVWPQSIPLLTFLSLTTSSLRILRIFEKARKKNHVLPRKYAYQHIRQYQIKSRQYHSRLLDFHIHAWGRSA